MDTRQSRLQFAAWSLTIGVVLIVFIAWAGHMRWHFGNLSTYSLFPLFGLLALSIMWAHYVMSAVRHFLNIDRQVLKTYFDTTSMAVLAFILLHPGMLIWQLWRDGFGLPPGSYADNYVAPGLGWVALLGTISLLIFIAFESRRFYGERPWWKYVQYASDAAMLAVFYHSLKLGSTLHNYWLQAVWVVFILTYILALGYIYLSKPKAGREIKAK